MRSNPSGLKLVVLLIDGVHFVEHVLPAAVGIDVNGIKHPPGLREGSTENAAARKELLAKLIERGLNPNRAILVVINDAKASRLALPRHKKRNVADALPERMRASVRTIMNQAHATRDPKRVRRLLENLGPQAGIHRPRRGCFIARRVGTNSRRDAPATRKVSSGCCPRTNLIENLFSPVRKIGRSVKRWQVGTMILRWTAAGVLQGERHFPKVAGYRALPEIGRRASLS